MASPLPLPVRSTRRAGLTRWLAPAAFLAPAVALLLVFLVYPLLSSFQLSTLDWNGLGEGAKPVGFGNWLRLAHDEIFWRSLRNNFVLAGLSVAVQLPIAMVLAVVLDEAGRGSRFLKIVYFLPLLMSSVAVGVLFKNIYDPTFGPINAFLEAIHLHGPDWLGDRRYALFSTIAVICWQNIPFYMMLFLAALAAFPREQGEAALLDGATQPQIFWRIKLPHLRGAVRTAVVLSVIGSLRYFDLVFVMTGGGPESASELMSTYMYRTVFASFQLGYGSTVASAMFLVVTAVAAIALRLSKRFETEV